MPNSILKVNLVKPYSFFKKVFVKNLSKKSFCYIIFYINQNRSKINMTKVTKNNQNIQNNIQAEINFISDM
ncbi:hypothetical protein, partial [Borreliella garinii]|uniref:hypothetical protein n=1 Tax=Borreliella garinii TaxID=29519 RepID=UPI001AED9455